MKKRISMTVSTVNKTVEDSFKEFTTKNLTEKTIEYYEMCMSKFFVYLNTCGIAATRREQLQKSRNVPICKVIISLHS